MKSAETLAALLALLPSSLLWCQTPPEAVEEHDRQTLKLMYGDIMQAYRLASIEETAEFVRERMEMMNAAGLSEKGIGVTPLSARKNLLDEARQNPEARMLLPVRMRYMLNSDDDALGLVVAAARWLGSPEAPLDAGSLWKARDSLLQHGKDSKAKLQTLDAYHNEKPEIMRIVKAMRAPERTGSGSAWLRYQEAVQRCVNEILEQERAGARAEGFVGGAAQKAGAFEKTVRYEIANCMGKVSCEKEQLLKIFRNYGCRPPRNAAKGVL